MQQLHFSDEISAFGGIKKAKFKDKGRYACRVCRLAYEALQQSGVQTWYVSEQGERDLNCLEVDKFPLQVIVRNRLVGTIAHNMTQDEGSRISNVIHELRYLNPDICNPMINRDYAVAMSLASYEDLAQMWEIADRTNEVLGAFFHKSGIELVDFKLEFGRTEDGRIVIACPISPDNCRLWDESDGRVLDKDRFRQDLSDVCATYKEVSERV